MSRLFVIGSGPLIEAGVKFFSGQCLRTNHFVEPLLAAGHEIELFVHPISDREFENESAKPETLVERRRFNDLDYSFLRSNREERMLPVLQAALEAFAPAAILGVNPFPSYLACRLQTNLPVWCDLNGYAMAEGQARARIYDDDACLAHFLRHEKAIARRGDRFSTVSTPQLHALLGELALVGRLNKYTFDDDLAVVVPNAVNPHFLKLGGRKPLGDGLFRVLWCGGYNAWTDVQLLYNGLSAAMHEIPELRFISTGGMIDGHDEKTYLRFQQLIAASPHKERFELRGWVAGAEADELLLQCDLGINIDSKNYETVFGGRNRITTMLACGLPVLTTLGTEISLQLQRENLGLFIELGDADAFAETLRYAAAHRAELRTLGECSRRFALAEFECAKTIRPVLDWAADPRRAKDNQRRAEQSARSGSNSKHVSLNAIEEELRLLDENPLHELLTDRRDLRLLRRKSIFRLYKKIRALFGGAKR